MAIRGVKGGSNDTVAMATMWLITTCIRPDMTYKREEDEDEVEEKGNGGGHDEKREKMRKSTGPVKGTS